MFDIPISNNVKPALGLDSLASGNLGSSQPMQQAQPTPQPMSNPQPMQNNGFNQPMGNPQPMQNNGFNQSMGNPQSIQNNDFNQSMGNSQSMQNNGFNQPMGNPQPMQQPQMAQPQMQSQPMGAGGFTNNPRPKGNGVVLSKGQKVSLSKMNSALDLIEVGLGWDVATNTAIPYDLDAEAFMLGADGKVLSDDWFIFYNQPMSPDGSCKHMGDNKDGSGVGDDEVIQLQLSRVNPQVAKIAFVVSINEALERGHNFGGVQNAYVRVVDKSTNKELIKFNLTDFFADVTSMTVGELYLKNGEWRFNAVGQGLKTDLAGLCGFYGVAIQ